jgi:predicted nuclease with TOPRIM domain
MEYFNKEIDAEDYIDEGFLKVRAIIEVVGGPKEYLEELLNQIIENAFLFQIENYHLLKKEEVEKIKEKIKEALKEEKDLFDVLGDDYKKRRNNVVLSIYKDEVIPVEGQPLFTSFIEVELLLKNTIELFKFALNFTPSSIEIIEPTNIKIKNTEMQDFINEVVTIINQLFARLKDLDAENRMLKEQLNKFSKRPGFRTGRK